MPRLLQRVSQAPCERHVPHSPALGGRDVALPLGTRDRELPLAEVDVRPLQRHHLPASQPRLAAEHHDQLCHPAIGLSHLQEPLVLRELMKVGAPLWDA